jgi:hypothetical protein
MIRREVDENCECIFSYFLGLSEGFSTRKLVGRSILDSLGLRVLDLLLVIAGLF